MIFESAGFVFKAPPAITRARRVLIKPSAAYPAAYPVTTSPDFLSGIISGIRQVTDADIVILESAADGGPIYPVYQALSYDFPRVLLLDVNDSILVEVDNPLSRPLAVPTFWVPNVVLSSDYLISVTPLKVIDDISHLSIMNVLTLLPAGKYSDKRYGEWGALYSLGINQVAADLYFTLPFDLGIIEARQKFSSPEDPVHGRVEEWGKIFVGEPYRVDYEASETLGLKTEYLDLIKEVGAGVEK